MNTNGNGKSTTLPAEEQLYTPEQVAEILNLTLDRTYFLIGREIPYLLRNRTRMVRKSDLQRFIDSTAFDSLPDKRKRQSTHRPRPTLENPQTSRAVIDNNPPAPPVFEFYPPSIPDKKVQVPPAQSQAKAKASDEIIVISKAKSIVDWLRNHGLKVRWVERAYASDVAGKHIVAHALPYAIAIQAASISWVETNGMNPMECTAQDLDEAEAHLVSIVIARTETPAELSWE